MTLQMETGYLEDTGERLVAITTLSYGLRVLGRMEQQKHVK